MKKCFMQFLEFIFNIGAFAGVAHTGQPEGFVVFAFCDFPKIGENVMNHQGFFCAGRFDDHFSVVEFPPSVTSKVEIKPYQDVEKFIEHGGHVPRGVTTVDIIEGHTPDLEAHFT